MKVKKGMTAALVCAVAALTGCAGKPAEKTEPVPELQVSSAVAAAEDLAQEAGNPLLGISGEYWEAVIGPGNYLVGTDIPVCVLNMEVVAGEGRVVSTDGTLNLDMVESGEDLETVSMTEGELLAERITAMAEAADVGPDLDSVDMLTEEEMSALLNDAALEAAGEERSYYEGVGFMAGVVIHVSGSVKLRLVSEDADVMGMKKRSRVGDPVALGEGTFTAGKDFDPGTYVITAKDGIGSVAAGDGSMFVYMGVPEEEGINSGRFVNYTCAEGDELRVEGLEIELQQVSDGEA